MNQYTPKTIMIRDYMLNLAQPMLQPIASQYAPGEPYHKKPIFAIAEGDLLRVLTQPAIEIARARK